MRCNTNIGSSKLKSTKLFSAFGGTTYTFQENFKLVVIVAHGVNFWTNSSYATVNTSQMGGIVTEDIGKSSGRDSLHNVTIITPVKKGEIVATTAGYSGWTSIIGYK